MSTLRAAIRTYLAADTALMALLTGGLYADVSEISRQTTPNAFDANAELRPCGLVTNGGVSPVAPYAGEGNGAREYLTVYLYDRIAYATIDSALATIFTRLQQTKAGVTGVWEIRHTEDSPDLEDQGLAAKMRFSRWLAYHKR